MSGWDRYRPQFKTKVLDVSFVSMFWILRFVFTIACAPCDFFCLNNKYMIYKKKEKKEKGPLCFIFLVSSTSSDSNLNIMGNHRESVLGI